MTNGEKLKEVFPNGVLTSGGNNSYYWGDDILVSKNWWNAEYQEPTTKNNLAVEEHKGEQMDFPNTFDEFVKDYGFRDKQEVYTNGSELIQVFRVKQWLEHISTTKNDLEVDCIDRAELLKAVDTWDKFGCDADTKLVPYQDHYIPYIYYDDVIKCIKSMPSVTPQPRKGHWIGHREHCENLGVMPSGLGVYEWCSNCDCSIDIREWHRNNYNFCPNCGTKMVEPQESEDK